MILNLLINMRSRLSKLIINAAFSLLVFVSLLLMPASFALAADAIKFTPQIPIPGFSSGAVDVGTESNGIMTSDLLTRYIKAIYDYGLKATGILAAVILMGGGLLWLTSAGNESKIGQAKEMIVGAISGLVILFSAWLILNTVNPALLKLTPISLEYIGKDIYGCCQYSDKAEMTTNKKCADGSGTFKLSETNTIFNNTSFYAVSIDGKECTMPGCCVMPLPSNSGFKTSKCMNATSAECPTIRGEFIADSCEVVASNDYYGCQLVDSCESAENGDKCFPGDDYYYCYDKTCWGGDAELNEPCGSDQGAICKKASECSTSRSLGGRDCNGTLACCKAE